MRKRVETGEVPAVRRISESIKNFKKVAPAGYSNVVEFAISEVVKDHLRESVRKNELSSLAPVSLDDSIEHVAAELEKELAAIDINFDCSRYFRSIKKKLAFPSRQVVERGENLDRLKAEHKLTPSWSERLDSGVSVEFTQIGFIDAVEAVFLNPLTPSYDLRTDTLDDAYDIRGDEFPFEIWVDGVNYVLDDDGTIFVSVERLSQQAVPEILNNLRLLANRLYAM